MSDIKEGGIPPLAERKKMPSDDLRYTRYELLQEFSDEYSDVRFVRDGKLGSVQWAEGEQDPNNPKDLALVFDKGEVEIVPFDTALEVLNATDKNELKRLEDARWDAMEKDPKDPDVVFNGYCWQRRGDDTFELGTCSGCGKKWGSALKTLTCTCGGTVSLT